MSARLTDAERALRSITEGELLSWLQSAAQLYGFRFVHFRPAKTDRGWKTAVQGDGVGFPDTLMTKGSRCIVAELKREMGKTTPEQDAWLEAFRATAVEAYVWRPSDRQHILEVLRGCHTQTQ